VPINIESGLIKPFFKLPPTALRRVLVPGIGLIKPIIKIHPDESDRKYINQSDIDNGTVDKITVLQDIVVYNYSTEEIMAVSHYYLKENLEYYQLKKDDKIMFYGKITNYYRSNETYDYGVEMYSRPKRLDAENEYFYNYYASLSPQNM
jgi:hypothetical protein